MCHLKWGYKTAALESETIEMIFFVSWATPEPYFHDNIIKFPGI